MAETSIRVFVTPALNIRPGDKVLINFGHEVGDQEWADVMGQLRERFPDVEFSALFGAEQVIVQPAEPQPDLATFSDRRGEVER